MLAVNYVHCLEAWNKNKIKFNIGFFSIFCLVFISFSRLYVRSLIIRLIVYIIEEYPHQYSL